MSQSGSKTSSELDREDLNVFYLPEILNPEFDAIKLKLHLKFCISFYTGELRNPDDPILFLFIRYKSFKTEFVQIGTGSVWVHLNITKEIKETK